MKQKIEVFNLYKKNATTTFFSGYPPLRGGNMAPIGWLIHSALLPVTMTLGVGTKTLIDVLTRHPSTQEEKERAIKSLSTLSDDRINTLVKNIVQCNAFSDSSQALVKNLEGTLFSEQGSKKAYRDSLINKAIKNNRKAAIKTTKEAIRDKLSPEEYASFEITINVKDKPLTQDELNAIDIEVDKLWKTKLAGWRASQRELIVAYLQDNKNVGKKTENVIMDNVLKNTL